MDIPVKPPDKKKRTQIPQSVRFTVFRRDNFTCRYCRRSSPEVTLHCDHAVSVKNGGPDSEDNLVTSCVDCNLGKRANNVAPKVSSIRKEAAGLVGMYGHTFDERGHISWQFAIIQQIADNCVCQLFSWWDGGPTSCILMSMDTISKECKLYTSFQKMNDAFLRECEGKRYDREEKSRRARAELITG